MLLETCHVFTDCWSCRRPRAPYIDRCRPSETYFRFVMKNATKQTIEVVWFGDSVLQTRWTTDVQKVIPQILPCSLLKLLVRFCISLSFELCNSFSVRRFFICLLSTSINLLWYRELPNISRSVPFSVRFLNLLFIIVRVQHFCISPLHDATFLTYMKLQLRQPCFSGAARSPPTST